MRGGVRTDGIRCSDQIAGDTITNTAAPSTPPLPPELPDGCPVPSVRISAPPPGVIGETVASIELKVVDKNNRSQSARFLEVSVERLYNKTFSDGSSFRLDVIIGSSSPNATIFNALTLEEFQSDYGGQAIFRGDLNEVFVGSTNEYLSQIAAHELVHALGCRIDTMLWVTRGFHAPII